MSVWKTLPDTPMMQSATASISGSLLAVGGRRKGMPGSPAVHVFLHLTNSWVTGNLPEPCYDCTAVQLSSNQLLVVGGSNKKKDAKTVLMGSIII